MLNTSLLGSVGSTQFFSHLPNIFFSLDVRALIDILIAAFFLYLVFVFVKQTRSYFIFTTFALLFLVSYLADIFDLTLTQALFQPLLTFFVIIFIVVFQREIRRFFSWLTLSRRSIGRSLAPVNAEIAGIIVRAVAEMSKVKMGALIVLSGDYPLDDIIEGGFDLDGKISMPLILSIFDHTTPGHDGAMIIEDKVIKRFGVHLPLAEDYKNFSTAGTRHRAGVGVSERTDALAIIVSEERGTISVAQGGVLKKLENSGQLDDLIKSFLKEKTTEESGEPTMWRYLFIHNFYLKIGAVVTAFILWAALVSR
jgi:diadenylate cyclase